MRRIRGLTGKGSLRGPVHSAKQEITETIKFLTWLDQTHGRTAATCTQQDVDAYLADGPTTRTLIRTFFVIARKTHLNRTVMIKARQAGQRPILTQEQRLQWIRELITDTSESRPYRVAGVLLLLLAQPLVKVAALRTEDLTPTPAGLTIRLGRDPLTLPEPFADLVRQHIKNRPNMATTNTNSPWLFPSNRAGQHLHPNTIMLRLRQLGVDLRGAHNRALADVVTTIPPSLVADALGYSYQTVFNHAANAGEHWHGGMRKVFDSPYAPSTLGSFLRTFTFGHVRQLDAVACRVLAGLNTATPLLSGIGGDVLVDVDDTIIEVHGYAKQAPGSATRERSHQASPLTAAHQAYKYVRIARQQPSSLR